MTDVNVKEKTFETPDLGFAAYLKMKGLKLKTIGRDERRFKFIFNVNGSNIEDLKVQFINSESYEFDASVSILKLMIKNKEQ